MPSINLIQEQRLVARAQQKQVQFAILGTGGLGALLFLAAVTLFLDTTRLNLEAVALQQKADELKPTLEELDKNQEALEAYQPRIETLNAARKDSTKWENVLAYLTTNTPGDTWLTSVKAFKQDVATPMVVTFNGVSTKQEFVGDFQYRLGLCGELEHPTLKYTQPRVTEKGQLVEFEVTADMKGTKQEDDAKEVKQK